MNNKTVFYGLVALGGVLAYYAWKEYNLSTGATSQTSDSSFSAPTTNTSGGFIDDVSLLQNSGAVKSSLASAIDKIKTSASQVVEPLFGKVQASTTITGVGKFSDQ